MTGGNCYTGIEDEMSYHVYHNIHIYSKTCVKRPLKKEKKKIFKPNYLFNAAQKYCRREHSAILLTFIKLPIKYLSLRHLFCLYLSGCSRKVSLFKLERFWYL